MKRLFFASILCRHWVFWASARVLSITGGWMLRLYCIRLGFMLSSVQYYVNFSNLCVRYVQPGPENRFLAKDQPKTPIHVLEKGDRKTGRKQKLCRKHIPRGITLAGTYVQSILQCNSNLRSTYGTYTGRYQWMRVIDDWFYERPWPGLNANLIRNETPLQELTSCLITFFTLTNIK